MYSMGYYGLIAWGQVLDGRNLTDSDSVLIYNAVEALIFFRKGRKILDGAKIVTQMQIAAGLNAG